MVEPLRVAHTVVILVMVGAYTYFLFVGFHGQSFQSAKKSFEEMVEKNIHMKKDIEKWKEEMQQEEMIKQEAEELEKEAQRIRELLNVDKVGRMELELKLLREKLSSNTADVKFVNQKVVKKDVNGNNGYGIKIDKKVDMKEQARRIKHQMDKLNLVPDSKTHISEDGIRKVSNKDGVHVPEDLLENIQYYYTDDPQMEDLMEDYRSVIESPSVEEIVEKYSETGGYYLAEEDLLAEFHYVEEEPEDDQEEYEPADTGGFCEMEGAAGTCGFG